MPFPSLAVTSPTGFAEVELTPPKIAESSGAVMTEWRASSSSSSVLAMGCVATPIPGWVEDMRPQVEGRTRALANAASERITGSPIDARVEISEDASHQEQLVLRAASDLTGPRIGVARTFVGFSSDDRVFTCFVTCTRTNVAAGASAAAAAATPLGCEESVARSSLQGSSAPPKPGAILRTVHWGVHHPREAAVFGAIVLTFVGIAAIVVRRRPRFRF